MKDDDDDDDFQAEVILKHNIHTGSRDHPVSYPMGTGISFHRGKAAGT
jgi:hypothetical protein